jgi:hypothetical protein
MFLNSIENQGWGQFYKKNNCNISDFFKNSWLLLTFIKNKKLLLKIYLSVLPLQYSLKAHKKLPNEIRNETHKNYRDFLGHSSWNFCHIIS